MGAITLNHATPNVFGALVDTHFGNTSLGKLTDLSYLLKDTGVANQDLLNVAARHLEVFGKFYVKCIALASQTSTLNEAGKPNQKVPPIEDFLQVLATGNEQSLSKILRNFRYSFRSVLKTITDYFGESVLGPEVLERGLAIWAQPDKVTLANLYHIHPGRIGYALPHRYVAGFREHISYMFSELSRAGTFSDRNVMTGLEHWQETINNPSGGSYSNQRILDSLTFPGSFGSATGC